MGRPKKVIDGGSEIDLIEDDAEASEPAKMHQDAKPFISIMVNAKMAYIKNGVTILRKFDRDGEKALLADGWKRK